MNDIYQEEILELYQNPLNFGKIEDAEFYAKSHNPLCGDSIEISIRQKNGKINEIKHCGKGCAISQVSASLLTEHLKGMEISEAGKITKEDVLKLIKIDLSKNPSRMKCALLSLETLKKALNNKK